MIPSINDVRRSLGYPEHKHVFRLLPGPCNRTWMFFECEACEVIFRLPRWVWRAALTTYRTIDPFDVVVILRPSDLSILPRM